MGRFSVPIQVANNDDMALARRGLLPDDQVRRQTIDAFVDTGAVKLVLPQSLVKELGLPLGDTLAIRYADGRRTYRRQAEGVYVEILGQHGVFTAVVEPRRTTALLGAIVLEDFDLLADCLNQRLVPRHPEGPLCEIE